MTPPAEWQSPAISLAMVAQVCEATNDPHPLHLDQAFARRAGYQDVVVPAHLLIGWVGQYLQDWCGATHELARWSLRFTAPVWPGDVLSLTGEALPSSELPEGVVRVQVRARNQSQAGVGLATAELSLKAQKA